MSAPDFADRAAEDILNHLCALNTLVTVDVTVMASIIRRYAVAKPEPRNADPPTASPAGSYHDDDPCDGAV